MCTELNVDSTCGSTVVGKCQQAAKTYREGEHRCALVVLLYGGMFTFFRFFRKVVQLLVQTISRIVIKALLFFP